MAGFWKWLDITTPGPNPPQSLSKDDRVFYWLSVGAQPTEAVDRLFKQTELWDRYERFKAGEDVDALVEEGKKVYDERVTDYRTNPPANS